MESDENCMKCKDGCDAELCTTWSRMHQVTPNMVANVNLQWSTGFLKGMNVLWFGEPHLLQPDEEGTEETAAILEHDDLENPTWEWALICNPDGTEWHVVQTSDLYADVPVKPCGHPHGKACHTSEDGKTEECVG